MLFSLGTVITPEWLNTVVTFNEIQTLTNKTLIGSVITDADISDSSISESVLDSSLITNSEVTNPENTSQTLGETDPIDWDANQGGIATLNLTGDVTVNTPTNLKVGTYILHVVQQNGGSHLITWSSDYLWPGGVAPTLSTTDGAHDIIALISNGSVLFATSALDFRSE